MPTIKEQLLQMTPEQRKAVIQRAKQELEAREKGESVEPKQPGAIQRFGGRLLEGAKKGLIRGVETLPEVIAGEVPARPTDELAEFEEKERIKRRVAGEFEKPEKRPITRVGILGPEGITEVETDVDRVLKAAVEKPEAELKSSDLINIARILTMDPAGEATGGFFGIGGKKEFTPEQKLLREQAQALLDKNAARVEISGEFSKEEEDLIKENMRAHKKSRAEVISALRERGMLP